MIAQGRLQHHFWGDYHASIVLAFNTPEDALKAQAAAFTMFTVHPREPKALTFHGTGEALKAAEAALKAHGADMKKVRSLARSIDYGEPFTVEVILPDGSTQQDLF